MDVYIDIDNTCIDTCGGIKKFLAGKGVRFDPSKVETYGFDGNIGCGKEKVYACFKEQEMYDLAKVYAGVKTGIKRLKKEGFSVFGYSYFNYSYEMVQNRLALMHSLGMKGGVYMTEKPPIKSGYAVFDDCVSVLERWYKETEAHLFLIDQSYNKRENNSPEHPMWNSIIRCKSLKEGVDRLLELGGNRKYA